MKKPKINLYIYDKQLKNDFKALAAKSGMSMGEALETVMNKVVKSDKPILEFLEE